MITLGHYVRRNLIYIFLWFVLVMPKVSAGRASQKLPPPEKVEGHRRLAAPVSNYARKIKEIFFFSQNTREMGQFNKKRH